MADIGFGVVMYFVLGVLAGWATKTMWEKRKK